jgi:hypothetical protein
MAQGFSAKSRITVVFAGVSDGNVSRETFLVQEKENASRNGLFLRIHIAEASRDVQIAQRISAKVRITVVAVGLFDSNVSRETVRKFRRTKREQFSIGAKVSRSSLVERIDQTLSRGSVVWLGYIYNFNCRLHSDQPA